MIDRNWRGDTIDEEIDEIFKMFEQSFCLEGHSGAPFHHQHIFTSPKKHFYKRRGLFHLFRKEKIYNIQNCIFCKTDDYVDNKMINYYSRCVGGIADMMGESNITEDIYFHIRCLIKPTNNKTKAETIFKMIESAKESMK